MSRKNNTQARQIVRLLQFLSEFGSARLMPFDAGSNKQAHTLLVATDKPQRQMLIGDPILRQAKADDLVIFNDSTCCLSPSGKAHLRRHQSLGLADGRFAEQHRNMVAEAVLVDGERQTVRRNLNESPLSKLRQHHGKDGRPWLSDAAFSAGERLRADFTRAHLMPSVTSNWNAAMGGSQRSDGQGGKVALSETALDAQDRFNRALKRVGPELADVLIDVCCYLKGLQQVEREQGWPPRSAKLMVRTGLGLLAQHYGTVLGEHAAG